MFGRKKDKAAPAEATTPEADTREATSSDVREDEPTTPAIDLDAGDDEAVDHQDDELADDSDDEPVGDDRDEWDELDDSRDWRDDGPFDITEVDLDDDPVQRVDFGTLILTPREGMNLQLQVDQTTHEVPAALVMRETSGLEIALFAAPASGGMRKQVREAMIAGIREQGGQAEQVEGPFGTEVRAQQPVTGPNGEQGLHVSRTWLAAGPRWLLRGMLMGQAAMDDADHTAAEFEEFFRDLVVRRGDAPLAPGQVIPMVLPEDMRPQQ